MHDRSPLRGSLPRGANLTADRTLGRPLGAMPGAPSRAIAKRIELSGRGTIYPVVARRVHNLLHKVFRRLRFHGRDCKCIRNNDVQTEATSNPQTAHSVWTWGGYLKLCVSSCFPGFWPPSVEGNGTRCSPTRWRPSLRVIALVQGGNVCGSACDSGLTGWTSPDSRPSCSPASFHTGRD